MELFTGISLKGWLLIGLVAIGFILAGRYEYLQHQVTKDQTVITAQQVTIKSQQQAIKTDQVVAKIEEHTQVAVQQAVQKTVEHHTAIQHKVADREQQIEQTYTELPPTPENVVAEADQLSTARIDGLWQAYCATQPDAPDCQPQPSSGVPHA
jgi:hypothetical protein